MLDILSVLIHGTLVNENSEKGESENRKAYSNLIKKLKVRNKNCDVSFVADLRNRSQSKTQ